MAPFLRLGLDIPETGAILCRRWEYPHLTKGSHMARKAAKTPRSYEMQDLGSEPEWDDLDELTEDEVRNRFGNALNWYNYNYSTRNAQDFLVKWMKQTDGLVHYAPAVAALEPHYIGRTYLSLIHI